MEDRYRARVGELQADDEILRDVGPLAPMSEVVALPGWVGAIDEGEVYCSFKRTHGSFEAAFGNYVIDFLARYQDTQMLFYSWATIFAIAADAELC